MTNVNNPHEYDIMKNTIISTDSRVETVKPRPGANLQMYAMLKIPNYATITEIPDENMVYLNSVYATSAYSMFSGCAKLVSIDVSNMDFSKAPILSRLFDGCAALTTVIGAIDMSSCNQATQIFRNCNNVTGVHFKNVPRSLDLSMAGGSEGTTWIIDNYLD